MSAADRLPLGDQTDDQALSIIEGVLHARPDSEHGVPGPVEEEPRRPASLVFEPLVISSASGELGISFLLGPKDGTLYVQVDLARLVDAWEGRRPFTYVPRANHCLDFAAQDIDDESRSWMELVLSLRDEARRFNEPSLRMLRGSNARATTSSRASCSTASSSSRLRRGAISSI